MGEHSKIEWTDTTWNPVVGCTRKSAGCDNCYAVRHTQRLAGKLPIYQGLVNPGKRHFNGTVRTVPERLEQPLHWRKPRMVFVNSLSDLFHPAVPFDFIDEVFAIMALTPRHTYQVLTKRPERMAEYFAGLEFQEDRLNDAAMAFMDWDDMPLCDWPLSNVWIGTSVENQAAADERIPHLLRCPAAVRFLSCEPLLGPVKLDWDWLQPPNPDPLPLDGRFRIPEAGIHWIIAGGESGGRARALDVDWIYLLKEAAVSAGIPLFVKQLGARIVTRNDDGFDDDGADGGWPGFPNVEELPGHFGWQGDPVRVHLRHRKGGDPSEWPEDLRVREFSGVMND